MEYLQMLIDGKKTSSYQRMLAQRELNNLMKELDHYRSVANKYAEITLEEIPEPEKIEREDTDEERLNLEDIIERFEYEIELMESLPYDRFNVDKYKQLNAGLDRARNELKTRENARNLQT